MVVPGDMRATVGPEYGPGGLEVPGSRKDLTKIYYSQGNGTLVTFGKDMSAAPHHEYANPGGTGDWLRHRDGPGSQSQQEQILRGVHTSKFKKGFNRRQYGDIQQDVARKERE
jgi:hypothetical protein